ncbi:hypothetical protein BIFGAL_03142 [Bifidobacterium gallicum DSM 20093 = LMG 11596]|uniref:Uncharacterized protein n=1 Tax=Bifidobacterium gallicum DSM 20093 = LMG 11596 TaxID=561180 RepID=D1NTI4_9BIFI|nr:hypothetical protein BIFGAL_03142 [Bifidobacterium gallicum DSM 20093 = LMG 11596]
MNSTSRSELYAVLGLLKMRMGLLWCGALWKTVTTVSPDPVKMDGAKRHVIIALASLEGGDVALLGVFHSILISAYAA